MAFHRCNRFMVGLLLLSLPAALAADTDRLKQYCTPWLPWVAESAQAWPSKFEASSWTAPTRPG